MVKITKEEKRKRKRRRSVCAFGVTDLGFRIRKVRVRVGPLGRKL
jgi:hypothetical protein